MERQEKRWILRETPADAGEVGADVPRILWQLMRQRGVEPGEPMERFLRPKLRDLSMPFELPEMDLAVDRVFEAIDQEQKICIYGDYDVDGITSVALMTRILQAYGAEVASFIPKRGSEGYGLSEMALKRLELEHGKPDLMITVDCGTASVNEVAQLTESGVDVIIVDHHELSPAGRPDCVALVNPKFGESYHYLCAAGVCFKLAHALMIRRRLETLDLKDFIEMVAVATIADIVPLVDENRLLVRHGLMRLSQTKCVGLKALLKVANIEDRITSMDVGFRVGPRINAAGRMDKPEEALNLLLSGDSQKAVRQAEALDSYNVSRQKYERKIRDEALSILEESPSLTDEPVIVLGSRDWHPGVVGIVASRLMRQFYKPTFIVAIDEDGVGKGSGRSVEGVSLVESIHACMDHLVAGGGHDMAAGISVEEAKMEAFRDAFSKHVLENSTEEDRLPRLNVDAEIAFDELSLDFLDSYELLQPFGSNNPQPVFMSRAVWPTEAPRHLKHNHIKLFMRQGVSEHDAIYFGGGEHPLPDPPWDIAFTIDRNNFRGRTSLQMVIQDVRSTK